MRIHITKLIYILAAVTLLLGSCKKEWLDEKPDKSLVIPHTLKDYKALISGTTLGSEFNVDYGVLTEHGSADFYVSDISFTGGSITERNFYAWTPDVWGEDNYAPWTIPYKKILYSNIALEGIETITPINNAEQVDWNQVKGSALFFRAVWHYDIAKQFCKPYTTTTAADPGIPLRLNSDFNEVSRRSSVEESYNQILEDLKQSAVILPISTPINDLYKCQPSKTAAYAMLARVYLSMSNYDSAFFYSNKTLQLYNTLLDYNIQTSSPTPSSIAITANNVFARFNNEVIFHMRGATYGFLLSSRFITDSILYKQYDINDLRRTAFFRTLSGNITLKGSYDQSLTNLWTGLATDEIYLIRSECYARKNEKDLAMADLNTLLVKRWKNTAWTPLSATSIAEALATILAERRKELCFRSIRWTDLKRLNMEPQTAVTLTKKIRGQLYSLTPNSPLYVFPIPPNVIKLTGITQNPR